ncbi:MAG: hypothetical protein WKF87_10215 [Chryseolinea sp.]
MKKYRPAIKLSLFGFALCVLIGCYSDDDTMMTPIDKPELKFYALTDDNHLIKYNANAAEISLNSIMVTGVTGNEKILAVDFRPSTWSVVWHLQFKPVLYH